MGGGKETPRQKMIGMMYLVLTALLAMNVSKTVLLGYIRVNEGMENSRDNLSDNNRRVTEAFQKSIDGNPGAKPYYNRDQYQRLDKASKFDKEGHDAHAARIQNGFNLFGKYYQALWD